MRYKIPFLVTLLNVLMNASASAQSLRYSISLPYIGQSAYSTVQNDPLSFTANQAALGLVKKAGIGLYSERRFLLNALSTYRAAVVVPTQMGNFGFDLDYSGFKNFNENKIGLAYGKTLGPKIDVGIQFNYYGYRIPAYNAAFAINFEGGVLIHCTDKLNAGIHLYNPVGGKLGKTGTEKLAGAYKFGLGYDASANFFVSGEIIKEEDKPVNVTAGFQYHFAKQFFARAGFASASSIFFAAAGVGWGNWRVDVGGSYHPQLGVSPGLLLLTNFGPAKGNP